MQYRLPGETMTHTITIEEGVWQKRSGGGWLVVAVGLPPLLLGLGVFLYGMGMITLKAGAGPPPLAVTLGFGGILTLGGMVLVFGRSAVIIERRAGTIVKWWGVFGPIFRKTYHQADYDRVVISEVVRATRYERGISVHPVRLASDWHAIHIAEPRDRSAAQRLALDLANFLGLKLADESATVRQRPRDSRKRSADFADDAD